MQLDRQQWEPRPRHCSTTIWELAVSLQDMLLINTPVSHRQGQGTAFHCGHLGSCSPPRVLRSTRTQLLSLVAL